MLVKINRHAEYFMLIFPTATTVTRKRLNVTSHVNCVSRLYYDTSLGFSKPKKSCN
jgi:hypothetical protein